MYLLSLTQKTALYPREYSCQGNFEHVRKYLHLPHRIYGIISWSLFYTCGKIRPQKSLSSSVGNQLLVTSRYRRNEFGKFSNLALIGGFSVDATNERIPLK